MKLSEWARKQGITYVTAFNWFKKGQLPVKAIQTQTGTILIQEDSPPVEEKTVIYGRVSSHNKKQDLERQITRCSDFCNVNGWTIDRVFKEVASGMNDNRRELMRMFNYKPTRIVVENKDRLTRFGFDYLAYFLKNSGCNIVVMNGSEEKQEDLMNDLISIITSFCCRIYGSRGREKVKEIKQIIKC